MTALVPLAEQPTTDLQFVERHLHRCENEWKKVYPPHEQDDIDREIASFRRVLATLQQRERAMAALRKFEWQPIESAPTGVSKTRIDALIDPDDESLTATVIVDGEVVHTTRRFRGFAAGPRACAEAQRWCQRHPEKLSAPANTEKTDG